MTEPRGDVLSQSHGVDYLHHAKQWPLSGINQRDYCQRHGLRYSRFVTTRSKLVNSQDNTTQNKLRPHFVPLKPSFPSANKISAATGVKNNSILIRLPKGSQLEFPAELPIEQLAALFKALEAILC